MSALRSLSGGKRTYRGHRISVVIDPQATSVRAPEVAHKWVPIFNRLRQYLLARIVSRHQRGNRMKRREFMRLIGAAACAWPCAVAAQAAANVYRIATLNLGLPVTAESPAGAAICRGLAKHGYTLGQNLQFESRGAEMERDRLPRLLDELVASKVDVIVTFGYPAALVAKQGTTLPIVSFTAGDPVGTGLVDSLARPGGHITGISDVSAEMTPKRMELLREIVPRLRRVAILWNATDPGMTLRYRASETGAKVMGIEVQPLGVREPNDFEQAFAAMISEMPDAILMVSDVLTMLNRTRVIGFAAEHRLPAIYEAEVYVRDGGLMSYGPDQNEGFARVADLLDRILKGAKPADLPFEQPTLFKMVLNLRTAKTLGLTIPPTVLARADEVIE
jgi:putative tryptophan/tyrosine transport system substrate-binding protein